MNALAIALAALASFVFALAGYLVGARFGRAARDALRRELSSAEARIALLDRALAEARSTHEERVMLLEAALDEARATNEERVRDAEVLGGMERLRAELDTLARAVESRDETWLTRVRGEIDTLAVRMRRDEDRQLELARQLAPQVDRARLAKALVSGVEAKRNELPTLLATVAREGGFASVLLADEVGLLLAASPGAPNADALAGESTMLLSHGERAERRGMPRPLATLVHDEADRLTLHRSLLVQDRRYVLTAVARRENVNHHSLDPAVDVLERVLTRDAWQEA